MVFPSKIWEDFFQKESFSWGDKHFLGQINYRGVVGGLMVGWCQSLGGVSWMINAFSSRPNLKTKSSLEN